MKKSYKTLFKESFTKSFDERYAEMSKGEKIGHWFFGCAVIAGMVIIGFLGN